MEAGWTPLAWAMAQISHRAAACSSPLLKAEARARGTMAPRTAAGSWMVTV